MEINKLREDFFPVTKNVVFLDIANHSPPCLPVQNAIRGYLDDWDRLDRRGDQRTTETVASWSQLIGCSPDEACYQPNTSTGLSVTAESLDMEKGDNLVINDLENPANIYPWLSLIRKGVDIRIIRGKNGAVRLEDLEKAVDDNTKVVAISQVEWLTGARHDIKAFSEVAHDHGAHIVVDGIQAAGAIKIDVKKDDVDFYANGAYKWLLGCSGAGFLYVRKELIPEIDPKQWGYRSVEEHSLEKPLLKSTAKKYELGEPSYLSTVGTKAGIDLILKLGPKNIESRVIKLSQRLIDGLTHLGVGIASPKDKELRSGIVSFTTQNTEETFKRLKNNGFFVSLRTAGIRVSPDFYNTEEEIDRLLETISTPK